MMYMEILQEENLDSRVRDTLLLMGNALPSGTQRDIRGASFKQLRYICILARIRDDESLSDFTRVIDRAGGMDSLQAHVVITGLQEQKFRERPK